MLTVLLTAVLAAEPPKFDLIGLDARLTQVEKKTKDLDKRVEQLEVATKPVVASGPRCECCSCEDCVCARAKESVKEVKPEPKAFRANPTIDYTKSDDQGHYFTATFGPDEVYPIFVPAGYDALLPANRVRQVNQPTYSPPVYFSGEDGFYGGSCSGGSCGVSRGGLFRRWK